MAAAKKPATKKATAKKTTTAKPAAKKATTAAKKPVTVSSLTATEKKLVKLYRGAKTVTKAAALALLKADHK